MQRIGRSAPNAWPNPASYQSSTATEPDGPTGWEDQSAPPGRIDAHVHLLQGSEDYPWITDDLKMLRANWPAAQLWAESSGCGTVGAVAVQAVGTISETTRLLEATTRDPRVLGVVGWVDLAGDVPRQLDQLRSGTGGQALVGIRHQVHDEPDPNWLTHTDVQSGLRRVAAAGLSFDLLIRARESPAAVSLARAIPELRLVIDHLLKPPLINPAQEEVAAWRAGMTRLALETNVVCKLSGLTTEAVWDTWTPAQLQPYLREALDLFGPSRCIFGSDWPVCRLAGTYQHTSDLVDSTIYELAPNERAQVRAGNAKRIYRLHDPHPVVCESTSPRHS